MFNNDADSDFKELGVLGYCSRQLIVSVNFIKYKKLKV